MTLTVISCKAKFKLNKNEKKKMVDQMSRKRRRKIVSAHTYILHLAPIHTHSYINFF